MESINHKFVFDAAKDLRIGSEMLGSKFGESVFPLRSTIVTAAFSAELYLKCLLYISGKEVPRGRNGHDLKALYEKLDKDTQQKIKWKNSEIRSVIGVSVSFVQSEHKVLKTSKMCIL